MVLISKGTSFSLAENFEAIPSAYSDQIGIKVMNPLIVPSSSSFSINIVCDNDLAEYCLGCKLLQWDWGTLTCPSAVNWGIKYADVLDPKAKVQPTAADLRTRYIENINKLVANQEKVANFSLTIGAKEESEDGEVLAMLQLSNGKIVFNQQLASEVPLEEDIRSRSDLWSVTWQASPAIFLHRKTARKFVALISEDKTLATLAVSIRRVPAPEAAAIEGNTENVINTSVNVAGILAGGCRSIELRIADKDLQGMGIVAEKTTLALCFSSNEPLVAASALDEVKNLVIPPKDTSAMKQVSSNDDNKDVLKEVRDEIVSTIERIAQEYLAIYPTPITTNSSNATGSSAAAAMNKEERKLEFMTYLTSNGIFHELRENLKPRVQTLIRDKFGVRGRALGRSGTMKSLDLSFSATNSIAVTSETVETALSELYVFLQKECSVVLNSMFSETIIDRDVNDLSKSATINDEEATKMQEYKKLKEQADDATADSRYAAAEALHLERIQLTTHCVALGSNRDILHGVYADYGIFLLQQASRLASIDLPKNVVGSAQVSILMARAREALAVSYKAKTEDWEISLLYACVLIESEQSDEAEAVIHETISSQLKDKSSYTLTSLQHFDGYDSDKLCPVDPKCHCVLAALFSMQKLPIRARKALLMANRSFVEGDYQPPVSTHGTPKRTVVLCLSVTSVYLFEHAFLKLGRACVDLALECELAVTEKAQARGKGKTPVTVPHIRHMLKQAQTAAALYPVELANENAPQIPANNNPLLSAVDLAIESELAAQSNLDKIAAWLTVAKVQSTVYDATVVINSFLNAIKLASEIPVSDIKGSNRHIHKDVIPLSAFITVGKMLLNSGRYVECVSTLLYASSIYTSATLLLILAVSYLRTDKLDDAEEALVESNLLNNKNADTWMYFSLLCLLGGAHRVEEAEQALFQALRLGMTSTALLRELATQFMAMDRMQTAEDLIRRALAQEAVDGNRQSLLSRKLLANVLAAQNQAASAVEEYQKILATPSDDVNKDDGEFKQAKLDAAEKCFDLLNQLGREEEMKIVKSIMKSLALDLHNNNQNKNPNHAPVQRNTSQRVIKEQ